MKVKCPVCGLPVEIPDDVMEGEVVEHDCGAVLEVRFENGSPKLMPLDGVADDWGE